MFGEEKKSMFAEKKNSSYGNGGPERARYYNQQLKKFPQGCQDGTIA